MAYNVQILTESEIFQPFNVKQDCCATTS